MGGSRIFPTALKLPKDFFPVNHTQEAHSAGAYWWRGMGHGCQQVEEGGEIGVGVSAEGGCPQARAGRCRDPAMGSMGRLLVVGHVSLSPSFLPQLGP